MIVFPVFIGTLFTYFLPRPILKTEALGLFNVYIEFLIKRSRTKFVENLRNSKIMATLIFCTLNVIIMSGMFKTSCPNFWFSKFHFNPSEKENKADICRCVHENLTCWSYLTQVRGQARHIEILIYLKARHSLIPTRFRKLVNRLNLD